MEMDNDQPDAVLLAACIVALLLFLTVSGIGGGSEAAGGFFVCYEEWQTLFLSCHCFFL